MRIGIDARLWNETGVGRYIRALVANLAQLDSTHTFVLFLLPKVVDSVVVPSKWEKIAVDARWHSFKEQLVIPIHFLAASLDLVHIPYFSVPLISPVPFVVTIHDLTISNLATGRATTLPLPFYVLKRAGYQLVMQKSIHSARHIITVSNNVKQELISRYEVNEHRISVTYESGEIENSTEHISVSTPKNYLLYVGNAHPHKNVETLIRAFILVRKNHPEFDLVLIGKNDFFYNRLRKQYAHLIEKGVHFQNEVNNTQLADWYQNARALIFPSLSEGFGIPGLEAMNLGTPVIASDIPVFHEVYQHGAYYFDQSSPQSIATAIQTVLGDKKLMNTLKTNAKRVANQYSWQKMAKETLMIYEDCLGL